MAFIKEDINISVEEAQIEVDVGIDSIDITISDIVIPPSAYIPAPKVISDLTDVNTAGVLDGEVLTFNTSSGNWEPAVFTNGVDGIDGVDGAQGVQGIQGIQGDTGATGATGADGIDGTQGIDGADGAQGITGDTGLTGDTGTAGLDGADSTVPGPQGIQGITGDTGLTGATGLDGADSTVAGPQGDTGIQGLQGDQGIQGITGADGADSTVAGPQGIQGITGDTGLTGDAGIDGTDGAQGIQGVQGIQGDQGVQGIDGADGVDGIDGVDGVQGDTGIQGIQGDTGDTGQAGADAGINQKSPVRFATATALPTNTSSGGGIGKTLTSTDGSALSIDGFPTTFDDRILVKDETDGSDNGIYKVTNPGGVGGTTERSTLNVLADAGSWSASGYYFTLATPTIKYYIWCKVNGLGTNPAPAGYVNGGFIDVNNPDGAGDDTAVQIAAKFRTAINNIGQISASVSGTLVTITNSQEGNAAENIGIGTLFSRVAVAVVRNGVLPSSYALTRAIDYDENDEIISASIVTVEEGNVNREEIFILSTDNPIVLETTYLHYIKIQGEPGLDGADGIDGTNGIDGNIWSKRPVRAATAGALPNVVSSGSGVGKKLTISDPGGITTIDGVILAINDRVLIKDQAIGSDNGIYFVDGSTEAGTVEQYEIQIWTAGSLTWRNNTYFTFASSTTKYYISIDTTDPYIDPNPPGYTHAGILDVVSYNSIAAKIARLKVLIDALGGISTTILQTIVTGDTIRCTNTAVGAVEDANPRTVNQVATVLETRTLSQGTDPGFNLIRATDYDEDLEVVSAGIVTVEEGDTNEHTIQLLATNNPVTIDTTALSYVAFSSDVDGGNA